MSFVGLQEDIPLLAIVEVVNIMASVRQGVTMMIMQDNAINRYFEGLMAWCIDTGIFYISGRDIACMILGFLICLVIWGMCDGKEIHIEKLFVRRGRNKDL